MTPSEAKKKYGAQYYQTMKDGITPQMYYRVSKIKMSEGPPVEAIEYLSFCNIWMGSSYGGDRMWENINNKLVKIN
jgi:hypothetical protein